MPNRMIDELYATMPWDKIDNVVFDVGNVLLSFAPDQILRDLLPECPDEHKELKRVIFQSPYWMMMDHGQADLPIATKLMIGSAPQYEREIRTVMQGWIEMKDIVAEGYDALLKCKAHGKKLYVMSNYGRDAFAHVEAKYDFFRLFDGILVSSREMLVKPDPAIYHLLTDRYGLEPARTLFIDDSPVNIGMALYCGWQGLCFNGPGRVSRFFAE